MSPYDLQSNYSLELSDFVISQFFLTRNKNGSSPIPNGSTINTMSTQAGPLWLVVEVQNKVKRPRPVHNVTVKVTGNHIKFNVDNKWVNNSMSYITSLPELPRSVASRVIEIAPRIGPNGLVTMTITATVDVGQDVNESNEQNNSKTLQFQVQDVS